MKLQNLYEFIYSRLDYDHHQHVITFPALPGDTVPGGSRASSPQLGASHTAFQQLSAPTTFHHRHHPRTATMDNLSNIFRITNLVVGVIMVLGELQRHSQPAGELELTERRRCEPVLSPYQLAECGCRLLCDSVWTRYVLGRSQRRRFTDGTANTATILLEFQIPPHVSRYASFMFSFLGRGICAQHQPPNPLETGADTRSLHLCWMHPPPRPHPAHHCRIDCRTRWSCLR